MVYPNTLQAVQNLPSPRGSERFQQKSFSAVCDDNPAYPPISQAARDQSTQERADQQPQKEQFLVRENPPFPPIHQAVKDHPNPDESVRLPEEGQSSDAGKGNISNPSKTPNGKRSTNTDKTLLHNPNQRHPQAQVQTIHRIHLFAKR